jgi:hypothetical protein
MSAANPGSALKPAAAPGFHFVRPGYVKSRPLEIGASASFSGNKEIAAGSKGMSYKSRRDVLSSFA